MDSKLDANARLDAADALAHAVKLQAPGARQDPPMFRALVGLLRERNEELRAIAFLALAPAHEYIIGGSGAGQFPPTGGWEKWLERIEGEQAGDRIYYRVCGQGDSGRTGVEPVDLFCAGGDLVTKNPAQAFRLTLQAAERGYVPAQEVVGMMYAIGKGVQQDYREAGKWFLTAAEAGNPRAAINYVGSLRSGMGNLRRDPEFTERWAKFLATHPEYSPVPGR
jgi:TPR repeat protein